MKYVDEINCAYGGAKTHMYSTANTKFKKICMQNKLTLLDASVRHLGTDINYVVLENLFAKLKDKVDFYFQTPVKKKKKNKRVIRFYIKMERRNVQSVLFQLDEVEVNGCSQFVKILIFPQNQIE